MRDVLRGHEDDPGPSALALRLLGSVHRLVLERRAGALATFYPSVGGTWEPEDGWAAFRALLEEQPDVVREWLDRAPQTNEVGRATALYGGLLQLPRGDLPVRLVEIGSSAGLNLRADRFAYVDDAGRRFGAPDAEVVLDAGLARTRPRPVAGPRRSSSGSAATCTRSTRRRPRDGSALTAYVWPDQRARLERLRARVPDRRAAPGRGACGRTPGRSSTDLDLVDGHDHGAVALGHVAVPLGRRPGGGHSPGSTSWAPTPPRAAARPPAGGARPPYAGRGARVPRPAAPLAGWRGPPPRGRPLRTVSRPRGSEGCAPLDRVTRVGSMNDSRAGQPAQPSDLVDVAHLVTAYYTGLPDPGEIGQRVAFGTSGHRGSSLDTAFNETHIVATTQAICDYRREQGYDGPLFIGRDTHGLSEPAWASALEVLAANDVTVLVDDRDGYTPTPGGLARDPARQPGQGLPAPPASPTASS